MVEFILAISICFLVFSQSPDFYLDLFVFGTQLPTLPTYYLLSSFFPILISISPLLLHDSAVKLSIKYIIYYLVFLTFSCISQFDFTILSDISLIQSLFSKISRSIAIFILSFLSYSVFFARSPSSLTPRKFTFYACILAFASLSSLFALVIYQADFFIPSAPIDRFTSTLSSEQFLNPFQIYRFGLVESIPYKSFLARSHWFVLEPIHFAFYLLIFYSISLLTSPLTFFPLLSFLLALGLLSAKSLTSFISLGFALVFFFLKPNRLSSRFFIILAAFLPQFLYFLSQVLIEHFFSFAGKSTNYANKVIQFDSFSSFLQTFLFGDQILPPIAHNLVFNSMIHFGIVFSVLASFVLITCLTLIYKPILSYPAANLSLSIVLALVLFQLPDPTHPLYALLLSYISAFSNSIQGSYAKLTST